MAVQRFFVEGLTAADAARVEERVRGVPGVFFAVASHVDACLEVDFEDDRVTTEEIRATISGLGFSAKLAG